MMRYCLLRRVRRRERTENGKSRVGPRGRKARASLPRCLTHSDSPSVRVLCRRPH